MEPVLIMRLVDKTYTREEGGLSRPPYYIYVISLPSYLYYFGHPFIFSECKNIFKKMLWPVKNL
jgi:hypothetical protein